MLQAWGLMHFSSKNDRRYGIFHEACSARLASDPDGTEIEAEDMLYKHSWSRSRSRQDAQFLAVCSSVETCSRAED